MKYTTLLFALCFTCASSCQPKSFGQQNDAKPIIDAITNVESADSSVFSGQIEAAADDGGFAGGMTVTIAVSSGISKPFSENFEVLCDSTKEDLLICSEESLPAMVVYFDGEDTITSTTYRDEEFSTKQLSDDVVNCSTSIISRNTCDAAKMLRQKRMKMA